MVGSGGVGSGVVFSGGAGSTAISSGDAASGGPCSRSSSLEEGSRSALGSAGSFFSAIGSTIVGSGFVDSEMGSGADSGRSSGVDSGEVSSVLVCSDAGSKGACSWVVLFSCASAGNSCAGCGVWQFVKQIKHAKNTPNTDLFIRVSFVRGGMLV